MTLRGYDYAGGRPTGAQIKSAGGSFVCRYLTDGGSGLPGKQLQEWEVGSMHDAGVAIVANYETTADRMLSGYAGGHDDALWASNYVASVGIGGAPIYFSADFDATESQSVTINAYLQGACDAIGKSRVGVYGGYWVVKRAFDAGVATYAWQTSAWSGGNLDQRAHIYQNMNLGYAYIAGVPCDINESLKDDFGQFGGSGTGELDMDEATLKRIIFECLETYCGPGISDGKDNRYQLTGARDLVTSTDAHGNVTVDLQKSFPGLEMLGNRTPADALGAACATLNAIAEKLGVDIEIKGARDPKPDGHGTYVAPSAS
ncbi:glycoside hydrolase domain-containing protein [Gordonia sp. N1V]|uniref:glycoside hydrolase domain-containing protein n=1 Tax=Gordonia sp. N1V TaxID=3034163 RepID=UPI0023E21CD6|nr:glycoside hydrolase domain-containing protein [Gordonia sp. N1V]MDF3280935.1 DUF1906 domain-containing protein [Gordonia sp. N1V]